MADTVRRLDWQNVGLAVAVVVALIAVGMYDVQQVTRSYSCPEKPEGNSVCIQFFTDLPGEGKRLVTSLPHKWLAFNGTGTTLAALLDRERVQYGVAIPSIANMPAGRVASQQGDRWVLLDGEWTIRVTNRDENVPLSRIDTYQLQDGDRVQLTFTRRRVGRVPLPPAPPFIDYVSRDAQRNGKDSLVSCVDNSAMHEWGGGYRFGNAEIPAYPRSPPVCGAHLHVFPPGDTHQLPGTPEAYILDDPILLVPIQLHLLGHGFTLVQYRPDKVSAGTVARLADWVRAHRFVYLAPYPNMTVPITLTRWGMSARLQRFNRTVLERFQQAPYGVLPPMHGEPTYFHTTPHIQRQNAANTVDTRSGGD